MKLATCRDEDADIFMPCNHLQAQEKLSNDIAMHVVRIWTAVW